MATNRSNSMDLSIHAAAEYGRVEDLRSLIESGLSVDACDNNKWTPLHWAVNCNQLEVVRFLVEQKCDLEMKTVEGETPLLRAAWNWSKDIADFLIQSGADVECCNIYGRTLLHFASRYGWMDVVKMCLDNKCDLNHKDINGNTPLTMAAYDGRKETVDLLIENGADVHSCGEDGRILLHYACKLKWLDIVELCADNKCDLNHKDDLGYTPLLVAATSCENKDVIDLLISRGADVHGCANDGLTLLHCASGEGWLDVVKRCVEEGCDVDCQKKVSRNTPLHNACFYKQKHIAEYLLESGAKWNMQNAYNETALCALNGTPEVEFVPLFLSHGFYFKQADYLWLYNDYLKEVFKNPVLCSQAIVNKFNHKFLPEFYERYGSSVKLPSIGKLQVKNSQNVAHEVKKCVEWEIQSKTHFDVMRFNPIVLKMLCVRSLISNI